MRGRLFRYDKERPLLTGSQRVSLGGEGGGKPSSETGGREIENGRACILVKSLREIKGINVHGSVGEIWNL